MNFSPSKTPIEVIREGAFGGTYFRDIYSGINGKWYKNSRKEFDQLKSIDIKFYASDYYDKKLNKYKIKTGISLRFWENNLVKKTDYNTKITEIENKLNNHNHDKYITTPLFNLWLLMVLMQD